MATKTDIIDEISGRFQLFLMRHPLLFQMCLKHQNMILFPRCRDNFKSCLWPRWQRTSGHFYPGLSGQNQMFSPEPSGSCVWTWPEHKLSVSPHHLHTFCFCSNGLSCVFSAWNLDLTYVLFTFCTCWVVLSVQVEDGAAERTETVLKLGRTVKYLACIEACCCELSSRRQQLL